MTNGLYSYYDYAENDYLFIRHYIRERQDEPLIFNGICSNCQNAIEKFLKHVIVEYIHPKKMEDRGEKESILKTHSLNKLLNYLHRNGITFDRRYINPVNGYYYECKYPGDDSIFVTEEDIEICWKGLEDTKRQVDSFICYVEEKRKKAKSKNKHKEK